MSVDLTRNSVIPVEGQSLYSQHVWPLKVVADAAEEPGLSSKIFVYHASGVADPFQGDVFECVASVSQMGEVPEDAPGVDADGNNVPYYRKDTLEFACRSAEEADDLWTKIQAHVLDLVQNHRAMTGALATEETVTVG